MLVFCFLVFDFFDFFCCKILFCKLVGIILLVGINILLIIVVLGVIIGIGKIFIFLLGVYINYMYKYLDWFSFKIRYLESRWNDNIILI